MDGLLFFMKNKFFINRMGDDWARSTTKMRPRNDKFNWFWGDVDNDYLLNGIDCAPYDYNKQDLNLRII
jgi:hypothetical protein